MVETMAETMVCYLMAAKTGLMGARNVCYVSLEIGSGFESEMKLVPSHSQEPWFEWK